MCGLPGFALPTLGLAWWLQIHSCLRERQSGLEDEGKWQLGAQELLIMGVSLTGRRDRQGRFHRTPLFSDLTNVKKPLDYIQNMSPNRDSCLI